MAGRVQNGAKYRITKPQFQAIRLIADGWPYEKVAKVVFDVTDGDVGLDEEKLRVGVKTLRKWFKDPKINDAYKEYLRDEMRPAVSASIRKLEAQINDENSWVANKAANDLLREFKGAVFGEDDKTIHVQIEGLPELGEPDD